MVFSFHLFWFLFKLLIIVMIMFSDIVTVWQFLRKSGAHVMCLCCLSVSICVIDVVVVVVVVYLVSETFVPEIKIEPARRGYVNETARIRFGSILRSSKLRIGQHITTCPSLPRVVFMGRFTCLSLPQNLKCLSSGIIVSTKF